MFPDGAETDFSTAGTGAWSFGENVDAHLTTNGLAEASSLTLA
jgi:hypothetical protein